VRKKKKSLSEKAILDCPSTWLSRPATGPVVVGSPARAVLTAAHPVSTGRLLTLRSLWGHGQTLVVCICGAAIIIWSRRI
jgi:hypothetical protein